VTSEDGMMRCFDVRKGGGGGSALWEVQAHPEAASAVDWCPAAAGILGTGSQDKLVKLWSVSGDAPKMIAKRNLQLGGIFDLQFCADSPALLGVGGAKGKLGVWNTLEVEEMQAAMPQAQAALGEDGRVMGGAVAVMGALDVNTDSDASDDEGGGAAPVAVRKAASEEEEDGEDGGGDDDDDDDDDDDVPSAKVPMRVGSSDAGKKKAKMKIKVKTKGRGRR